jgi:hypothetical protein
LTKAEQAVINDFAQALSKQQEAAQQALSFSAADEQQLVNLARERRDILKRLINEDPEQAYVLGLDRASRASVSKAVESELEEDVSAMGALEVISARPLDETQFMPIPSIDMGSRRTGKRSITSSTATTT